MGVKQLSEDEVLLYKKTKKRTLQARCTTRGPSGCAAGGPTRTADLFEVIRDGQEKKKWRSVGHAIASKTFDLTGRWYSNSVAELGPTRGDDRDRGSMQACRVRLGRRNELGVDGTDRSGCPERWAYKV